MQLRPPPQALFSGANTILHYALLHGIFLFGLNRLHSAIRLAAVDSLAGLLDLLQNRVVVDLLLGHHLSSLRVEADVVALDTCSNESVPLISYQI